MKHIDTSLSFLKGKRLLLACSGGVDSVVLAHLCAGTGLDITLAHCNFGLRGAESDGDETLVRNLATTLGVEVVVESFNTMEEVKRKKGSLQMVARELRYQWFNKLMDAQGFAYVLTAHHADDNLETFLINLSRGTGMDGLSGIPEQNNRVIRPLLGFSQEDISEFAKSEGIQWREDSSNAESKYLRNKIRHEIVPKLKELHPTFLENFQRTQAHLQQTNKLVHKYIQEIRAHLFVDDGNATKINIVELKKHHPLEPIVYGLFQEYGFTAWEDINQLLEAMSGKEVFSKTHRLLKDRTHLILSRLENNDDEMFLIHENDMKMEIPVRLTLQNVKNVEKSERNVVFLDKEKLNFPLVLRNWEKGDYFYPFGMKGKKKLSKFFKDEKVDVISKKRQWLLCSDHEIVWVVGRRPDERFKVDGTTHNILKITLIA
ncbi:MAG: tRNA lysidine(34) synthetase TilS [Allomuricauda sp.]